MDAAATATAGRSNQNDRKNGQGTGKAELAARCFGLKANLPRKEEQCEQQSELNELRFELEAIRAAQPVASLAREPSSLRSR